MPAAAAQNAYLKYGLARHKDPPRRTKESRKQHSLAMECSA